MKLCLFGLLFLNTSLTKQIIYLQNQTLNFNNFLNLKKFNYIEIKDGRVTNFLINSLKFKNLLINSISKPKLLINKKQSAQKVLFNKKDLLSSISDEFKDLSDEFKPVTIKKRGKRYMAPLFPKQSFLQKNIQQHFFLTSNFLSSTSHLLPNFFLTVFNFNNGIKTINSIQQSIIKLNFLSFFLLNNIFCYSNLLLFFNKLLLINNILHCQQ